MKTALIIISTFIGFISFAQGDRIDQIDRKVKSIELDSNLNLTKYDWNELMERTTDGGAILKVWNKEEQIHKIVQEIGLSYGRITIIIYLESGTPIKIIEIEENYERTKDGLNFDKLNRVFKAKIYVYDWEKDEGEIKQTGKRVMSEGSCSTFDYEPIVALAKKVTNKK